ncbi:hypothetical protein A3E39_03190 [Candidatus Uhrbacteria bacterium RIFCSPHIGHO2_12_FULL_60_25]|uniref:Cytotoxic translational repressor of toxin-antitoxin stability system n=1 Tax=Candidatus Uhrbacteria bacterium RIFCSPHIGHO2_12_FULL_60_25 TaxID=1802399 RepID=A0A1F7UL36_9BACT|nr:MAG: hypothetical protein A3D73_01320 [Candidatus Uhrbacteria bacterium RIFCSPHIGHO2_02_FULL_60_44]OGL78454.1 MAG: hypothetical protein A3E39_03190 [Candidatus Uhrbacteria bacterium RIFCSPHIGHO2_12_FULL_60_25]
MVDRINKALLKMSAKDRKQVLDILERVKSGDVSLLDLKKLQATEHVYRVRQGSFRIIFFMSGRESIRILDIERRSDTTYQDY